MIEESDSCTAKIEKARNSVDNLTQHRGSKRSGRLTMSIITKERQAGPVALIELSGRLCLGPELDELDEKLQSMMGTGQLSFLIDCSRVTAIDSQGIKSLVRGVISAGKRGGKFKLLKISRRVRDVLELTRLLAVIEAYDDEEAALKSFSG
jgi:anti-sigma B factor antagonist